MGGEGRPLAAAARKQRRESAVTTVAVMGMGPTAMGSKIPNVLMHNWSPPCPSIIRKNYYSSVKREHSGRLSSQSLVIETNVTGTAEDQSVARRLILLRHAKSSWEFPSLRGIHFTKFLHYSQTLTLQFRSISYFILFFKYR